MSSGRVCEAFAHCRETALQHEADRVLLAELAPARTRQHLSALAAFHWEISRIPDLVSEPMMGAIRRQWWREAWEEIEAGRPRRHPVVEALSATAQKSPGLPALALAFIDASEQAAETEPQTPSELAARSRAPAGHFAVMEAAVLPSSPLGPAVSAPLGEGWGIVQEIRRMQDRHRAGKTLLPVSLGGNPTPERLQEIARELGKAGGETLGRAVCPTRLARGYRALGRLYLKRLEAHDWNPLIPAIFAPTIARAGRIGLIKLGL